MKLSPRQWGHLRRAYLALFIVVATEAARRVMVFFVADLGADLGLGLSTTDAWAGRPKAVWFVLAGALLALAVVLRLRGCLLIDTAWAAGLTGLMLGWFWALRVACPHVPWQEYRGDCLLGGVVTACIAVSWLKIRDWVQPPDR